MAWAPREQSEVGEKREGKGDEDQRGRRRSAKSRADQHRRFKNERRHHTGEERVHQQFAAADRQMQQVLQRRPGKIGEDEGPGQEEHAEHGDDQGGDVGEAVDPVAPALREDEVGAHSHGRSESEIEQAGQCDEDRRGARRHEGA
jgi:hypothetical protein